MRRHPVAIVAVLLVAPLVAGVLGAAPAGAVAFTVTNTNDSGPGSLRKAIQDANATVAADVITFNIPGGGVHTITPTSPLPSITRKVTINGASEPGFSETPVIELRGTSAGPSADGLDVAATANQTVIRALAINSFGRHGIVMRSDANRVEGCFIGTNPTGTSDLPNGGDGISIFAGSANNTIGGPDFPDINLLSGNDRAGVFITGAGTTGTTLERNFIGTDAPGLLAIPNHVGVWLAGGASANTIGGSSTVRNVISGNTGAGVLIGGPTTKNNVVSGNAIGTNEARTFAIPNRTGVIVAASSHDNTVGGGSGEGNLISGNTFDGVQVNGPGTVDNVIQGNRIGTNPAGTSDLGNDIGVHIRGGARDNDVFGGNVISGNDVRGVDVGDPGTDGNVIRGNLIGLNAAGTAALANPNGLFIHNGASNTRIGGTSAQDRNVISGNLSRAMEVSINAPTGTVIQGNFVGLNAAGTAPVPNNTGVILLAGATDTTIGGVTAGARNVISGNTGHGIFVGDSTTVGTVIEGNRIGTNAAGTTDVGNGQNGVHLAQSANDVQVGGTTSGARNLISGNTNGVALVGSATNLRIQGNFIGTNAAGTGALGNTFHGIAVAGGAHDNLIGGKVAGAANTVAFNGGAGILIGSDAAQAGVGLSSAAGVNNAAFRNRIHSNGGLGIDLGPFDGVTPNDANDFDSGPNALVNFPILEAVSSGGGTFVSGTLDTLANRTFRVEFFVDPAPDPSAHGEGKTFLGALTVFTDASGEASFESLFAGAAGVGSAVSATATDQFGNTSEFSLNVVVT